MRTNVMDLDMGIPLWSPSSQSTPHLCCTARESGGRWSAETRAFLSQLVKARSREEIPLMQRRVEQAWRLRLVPSMLACASARASSGMLGSRELLRQRA